MGDKLFIVKRDGRKQKFDRNKIMKSCVKAGATKDVGARVTKFVAPRIKDGMSTRKIGELTIAALKTRDKKAYAHFKNYFSKRWK